MAFFHRPHFVTHRVVDDADDDFSCTAKGDAYGKMRDRVEEIHGAVDGVDDPLVFARLVACEAFLSIDCVAWMAVENDRFDEGLCALVEFQLDVVSEVFIDGERAAEIGAEESACGLGRVEGGLQKGIGCHQSSISVPEADGGKIFHILDLKVRDA